MTPKNLKKYLPLLLITGALFFSGCSQNLLEDALNDTPSTETATVQVTINTIDTHSNFSAQSFVNGTVNDITSAKITVTQTADGSILVDNQTLTHNGTTWTAELILPIDTELQFEVNSFNAQGRKIFSGTTTTTLQEQTTQVSITQTTIEDGATNLVPQVLQIARPSQILITSPTVNISFTVASSVSGNLSYEIIKDNQDAGTFSPQSGTIAIDSPGSSRTFDVYYAANNCGEFTHEIKLTNAQNYSAAVEFNTIVAEQEIPSNSTTASIELSFYPVITGLEAKSTAGGLAFKAAVDYTNTANLTYEWIYTPDNSTEDHATFNSTTTNTALLQGYSSAYSGTVTLTVRDASIYTTIEFVIETNQFPNDVVADSSTAGEVVQFADSNLELVVRNVINKPEGNIYKTDLYPLNTLVAENAGIQDLNGLEHCINLEVLDLNDNNISDISVLTHLTSLRSLKLNFNQINDISALSNLTHLNSLWLSFNTITDVNALSNLSNLGYVLLGRNDLTDITALARTNLPLLHYLSLMHNSNLDLRPGTTNRRIVDELSNSGCGVEFGGTITGN